MSLRNASRQVVGSGETTGEKSSQRRPAPTACKGQGYAEVKKRADGAVPAEMCEYTTDTGGDRRSEQQRLLVRGREVIVTVIGCPSRIAASQTVAAPTNGRRARRAAAVSALVDHHRRRGALRAYVYVRGRRGGVQPGGLSWYAAHLQMSGGGWSAGIPAASSGSRRSGGQFLQLCTAMGAMARAYPSQRCLNDRWFQ